VDVADAVATVLDVVDIQVTAAGVPIHVAQDPEIRLDPISVSNAGKWITIPMIASSFIKNVVQWCPIKKATRTTLVLAEAAMAADLDIGEEEAIAAEAAVAIAVAVALVTVAKHTSWIRKLAAMSAKKSMSVKRRRKARTREKPRGWC
jgi:hypothetical protein